MTSAATSRLPFQLPEAQALFSRSEVAKVLGVSLKTVERMEKLYGLLTPIKLTPFPNSPTYYGREEVEALVRGGAR